MVVWLRAEAAGDALLKRLASGAAAARRLASVAGLVPGAAEVGAVQLLDVQLAAGTGVLELEAGRFDVVPLPTSASDDVLAAGRLRRIPVSPAPGDLTNDGLEAWLSQPTLEAACWRPAPIDGAQESWLAGVAATALTTWWTGADGPDARSWAGSLGLEAGEVPWLPPLTGLLAAGVARAAPGGGRAAATLRALEAASRGLRTAPEWPRLWAAGLSVGALTGTARAWWPDPRRATPLAQPWSWVLVAGAALRVLGAAGPGAQLQLEAGTRSRLALVWAPATGILPAVVPTAGGRAAAAAADARIAAAAARRVVNLVAELLLWRAGPMSAAPLLAALWAKIRRALLAAGTRPACVVVPPPPMTACVLCMQGRLPVVMPSSGGSRLRWVRRCWRCDGPPTPSHPQPPRPTKWRHCRQRCWRPSRRRQVCVWCPPPPAPCRTCTPIPIPIPIPVLPFAACCSGVPVGSTPRQPHAASIRHGRCGHGCCRGGGARKAAG